MIDFYDLIEESNEMKLSNYTLEILNEMNNIINEKSESFSIVNENAFSTIWNKIKTFFKKIGEFIKNGGINSLNLLVYLIKMKKMIILLIQVR